MPANVGACRWLRLTVDDVVYGHLDNAYTVMAELNRRIDSAAADRAGIDPSLARTIARALNVPYVAIVDGDARRPAW